MANEVTFTISGGEQLALLGPEFEKVFKEEIHVALDSTLKEGEKILRKTIRDANAVASGIMLNSVISKIKSASHFDWFAIGDVEFAPPADEYGIYADKGRGPGKLPPLDRIISWVETKGIDREFAYPIARQIGAKGTAVGEWNLYDRTSFMDEAADRIDAESKRQYERVADRVQKRLDANANNNSSST